MDALAERLRVGRSVRAGRERRGWSLRVLAARLAVSPGTLSALENGTTSLSLDRLVRIAAELGVSPQELLAAESDAPVESGAPAAAVPPVPGGASLDAPTVPTGVPWRQFDAFTVDPALRGALAAFCKKGFNGASIREIAQESGLSVPGLYHYHASKQAMLAALLDLTMSDLSWRVEAARRQESVPVERLRITVECLALFHARRPGPALLGASEMRSLDPQDRVRIVQSRKRIQQMLYDDLAALGFDRPDQWRRTIILGNAISTMCTSVAQWFDPVGEVDAEQLARVYADAVVAMVAPSAPPPAAQPRAKSPTRKAHR